MSTNAHEMSRRDFMRQTGAIGMSSPLAPHMLKLAGSQADGLPQNIRQASGESLPPVAVIALNRMGFGPRSGDIDAFNALGDSDEERLDAYISQQLNPDSIDDSEAEQRMSEFNPESFEKTLPEMWTDHVVGDWQQRMIPFWEVERAAFVRAVYSRRQLVEIMADFWHNHFNVFAAEYSIGPVFAHYDRDVIRANLLGNFREFLGAVAKSPAMLYYLDNNSNTVSGPNENWARELFELYTMGAENYLGVVPQNDVATDSAGRPVGYVDGDIYEATRCFTGWTVNDSSEYGVPGGTGEFYYRNAWHDRFQKFVLGDFIPNDQAPLADGEQVLDLLAYHPGTARHICRKLCRRLISDNPPNVVVEAAADIFMAQQDAPDQIKQVIDYILRTTQFRSTWGEKVKRPFEYTVSIMRALDMDWTVRRNHSDSDGFMWNYNATGQPLFQWRPPNGYPDDAAAWQSTGSLVMSWRMAKWLSGMSVDYAGEDYYADLIGQTPITVHTARTATSYWMRRILGRDLPSQEWNVIRSFMAQEDGLDDTLPIGQEAWPGPLYDNRLRTMITMIMQTPAFHSK